MIANASSQSVVGGTNLMIIPDVMSGMTRLHFLSPKGKSHSFDHKADGYSRGEGISIIYRNNISVC